MMKDQSIRKLTNGDCRYLAVVMGFTDHALDDYTDRFVKIKITSPKRISTMGGRQIYSNENKGKRKARIWAE
jgi:hypothetical protein